MSGIFITPSARAFRIGYGRYLRNGAYPNAEFATWLSEETNKLIRFRVKEVASFATDIAIPGRIDDGSGELWRFGFHSSPYAKTLIAHALIAPGNGAQPLVRVRILNGASTVGDVDWYSASNLSTDVPSNMYTTRGQLKDAGAIAVIPADTFLTGVVSVDDDSAVCAVVVYEVALAPDTSNGYVETSFSAGTPIFDADREGVTGVLRDTWKSGAAHLWNWSDADAGVGNSSTTAKNLFDTAVTTVSAASPGVTLDLTNCSTVRRAADGVPVMFRVYASATVSTGSVTLKDSAGSTLLTVSVTGSPSAWFNASGTIPATKAKYDVHISAGAAGTINVKAFSLYQYEAP